MSLHKLHLKVEIEGHLFAEIGLHGGPTNGMVDM